MVLYFILPHVHCLLSNFSINGAEMLVFYLRTVSPGSSCKNAEANCGGGSYCNTDNYVCSCPTETVDESGVCIHIKVSGKDKKLLKTVNLITNKRALLIRIVIFLNSWNKRTLRRAYKMRRMVDLYGGRVSMPITIDTKWKSMSTFRRATNEPTTVQ